MLKQLLIPVAAFAVTATSAAAFGNFDFSQLNLNLSDNEVSALEEAQQIRETANEQARAVLEDAGIDDDRMHEIHDAMHEAREAEHEAMDAALEAGDYQAFLEAVANTPLADVIDSESAFETFKQAHDLRESGDFEGAQALMSELGLERPQGGMDGGRHRGFGGPGFGGGQQSADDQ